MNRFIGWPAVALLAMLSALAGCLDGKRPRVAGGDDIPNDVEPLGKRAAEARDDSADWNGFKSMPRTAPGMYDTTVIPDSVPDTAGAGAAQSWSGPDSGGDQAPAGGLAKRAAGLPGTGLPGGSAGAPPPPDGRFSIDSLPLWEPTDTLVTRVLDSLKGELEAVRVRVKDSVRTVDSTVFRPADPSRPGSIGSVLQVSGRETRADTSDWKTFFFRDADGDGSLAPRPGSANLADFRIAASEGGRVFRLEQRVAAGSDLDFNRRGDNRILSSLAMVTAGTDTLRIVRLLDADGDSAVIDFSRDTNLVDVVETHPGTADTGVSRRTIAARMMVYSRDSARNFSVRYRLAEDRRDGGGLVLEARGSRPDSTFRTGDDALWVVTRTSPLGADPSVSTRTFSVRLGDEAGGFGSNRLLRLETVIHPRRPADGIFAFSWTPDAPVPDGAWPAGGEVDASLTYGDGTATVFEGVADGAGMRGTVKASSGAVFPISFDREGRPAAGP